MTSNATSTISPNFSKIVVRIELVCNNFSAPFFSITLTYSFPFFFALPRNYSMACMNMDFWLCSCITYFITISTHINFIWCLPNLSCFYSLPHIFRNNYIYWLFKHLPTISFFITMLFMLLFLLLDLFESFI